MIPIPDEYKRFVNSVKRRCKYHGVKLVLSPSKNVIFTDDYKNECSGYFSDSDRLLVVACGKPAEQWIDILVHESAHMDQWVQKDPRMEEWDAACIAFSEFLQGTKIMNKSQLRNVIDSMIDLELDCEKRSVELIKKWKLPIDLDNYIRVANAYVLSYRVMGTYKRFPKGIGDDDQLLAVSPNKFLKSYQQIPTPLAKELHRFFQDQQREEKKAA
jgi:hypothetical protein